MAEWLNTAFSSIDGWAFNVFNNLAKSAGDFFTPISKVFAILGKGGWAFIVLAVILLLFKKTRKAGLTALIAIGIGALITNVTLKPLVARARPYVASEKYKELWLFVGGNLESESSFPSGHSTVSMASMLAVFLCVDKKKFWWLLFVPTIMAMTRIYLVVHYLTDVICGLVAGSLAAVLGYYIVKWLYKIIENNSEKQFCKFILEFDLIKTGK